MKTIFISLFLFLSSICFSQIDTTGIRINGRTYFYLFNSKKYGLALPGMSKDTISYKFAETFDGWTNASVQTMDSLIKRLPIYANWTFPQRLSIINFDNVPHPPQTTGVKDSFPSSTINTTRMVQYINLPFGRAVISSISIFHNGGTGKIILGIYDNPNAAGYPVHLLGSTNPTTVNSQKGWQTVNLKTPLIVDGGQNIFLSWVFENQVKVRFGVGNFAAISPATYSAGMPDLFGTISSSNYVYSIYANYTTNKETEGNVLKSTIPVNEWGALQMDIMMGDTATELWFDSDEMADTSYDVKVANGYHASRGIGGFFMGNTKDTLSPDFAGWVHATNGPPIANWPLDQPANTIATKRLMSYIFDRNGARQIGPSIGNSVIPASSSLVANWKFNGNGNDEAGKYPLTVTTPVSMFPTNSPPEGTNYISFQGSNYYATTNVPIGNEFSISFWFQTYNQTSDSRAMWGNGKSYYPNGYVFLIDEVNKYLKFCTGDGVTRNFIFSNDGMWTSGKWTHVVITASRLTGTGDMYVNGVKQTRASSTGIFKTFNASYQLFIGRSSDGSQGWCYMDDYRIYVKILTQDEITKVYNKQDLSTTTTSDEIWPVGRMYTPNGRVTHYTRRVRINTPGQNNGFAEVYENGHLRVQMLGLNFRSTQQGKDYGKVEGIHVYHFLGGPPNVDFSADKTQSTYTDNWVVYTYGPGSKMYGKGPTVAIRDTKGNLIDGQTIVPMVKPPKASIKPKQLLYDEIFTNISDTIYDTGNPYLYNPPFKKSAITKVISLSSGTINYTFLTAEFGDAGYGVGCEMWVKVYSGTGATKTLLKTFNLANKPTGNYLIPNNKATIEIYSGCNGGNTRGIAIKYWKL